MLLLGVTTCLFFVCMTPVAVLSIMFSTEMYLSSFPFQLFRAVANILEIVNFSMTFYIYCLFSTEFRQAFLQLIGCDKQWSVARVKQNGAGTTCAAGGPTSQGNAAKNTNGMLTPRQQLTPSPITVGMATTTTTPGLARNQSYLSAEACLLPPFQRSPVVNGALFPHMHIMSVQRGDDTAENEFVLLNVPATPSPVSNRSSNGFELHVSPKVGSVNGSSTNGYSKEVQV
jgi:hypothetical protein